MSQTDLDYTQAGILLKRVLTDEEKRRADVNNSGTVTSTDLALIQRYLNGGILTFSTCTQPSCTDSDGGKNPDVAGLTDGRVNGIGSYFNDVSVGSNGGVCSGDSCTSVAEGYCTDDGQVSNILTPCSTGYSKDGACATKPVAQPTITVLSPNGGETYKIGDTMNIRWSSKDLGTSINTATIGIELIDQSGTAIRGLSQGEPNDGSFNWIIQNSSEVTEFVARLGQYRIKVYFSSGVVPAAADSSDNYFTITASSEVNTGVSGTVALISADEDKAPKWGDGGYIHAPDWKWSINLTNSGLAAKNIKRMALVHNSSGEGWATDASANNPLSKFLYTLAITASQSASAEVYIHQTDALLPLWTINGSGGTKSFYAYGYPVSQTFSGGYLLVYFADNTSAKINIPSSNIVPSSSFKSTVTPDTQISKIIVNANLLTNDKMSEILAELNQLRSIIKEQQTQIKYLSLLLKNVQGISADSQAALNNFITYGVDANTQKLSAGERAAVINSYKAAFDKLPQTEAELADVIKIANGRFPSVISNTAEQAAKDQFAKIYKRQPDMNGAKDSAAVKIMSYGLRQKAENRNLNSEKAGIKIFKAIYGHTPKTTEEWNAMQAITYSGASRGVDSDGDLLTDDREEELGTDPKKKDTDGDGYSDGAEVANGYDPLKK